MRKVSGSIEMLLVDEALHQSRRFRLNQGGHFAHRIRHQRSNQNATKMLMLWWITAKGVARDCLIDFLIHRYAACRRKHLPITQCVADVLEARQGIHSRRLKPDSCGLI